jgi:ABC-type glutathione transport system ATPase component
LLLMADPRQPLIRVENLVKRYPRERLRGSSETVLALDDVSFSITGGTTLALVGESGSGKSTLALCLACLERPTSGSILFAGRNVVPLAEKELRAIRPQIQLVFQDPASSLNPRWTALELIAEPLRLQRRLSEEERNARCLALMKQVGLSPDLANRRASELSGGQKQRLAVARCLALQPKVLILDEVLSALDCSVQAQIANLLLELQSTLGLAYVFITHDLVMAAHLADEIAVMHQGRIVEHGSAELVMRLPQHEVTQALLAAAPRFHAPVPSHPAQARCQAPHKVTQEL